MQYTFRLNSFKIGHTRAKHSDTDYVNFALKIGNNAIQTQNRFMGNLNNGNSIVSFNVGLQFGPFDINYNDTITMSYQIINSGYGQRKEVMDKLNAAASTITSWGSISANATQKTPTAGSVKFNSDTLAVYNKIKEAEGLAITNLHGDGALPVINGLRSIGLTLQKGLGSGGVINTPVIVKDDGGAGDDESNTNTTNNADDGGCEGDSIPCVIEIAAKYIWDHLEEWSTDLWDVIFANCDGYVAADRMIFQGWQLESSTNAANPYKQEIYYPGKDSATGCGSNSKYWVTWQITRS